jgi:hypothetical protein
MSFRCRGRRSDRFEHDLDPVRNRGERAGEKDQAARRDGVVGENPTRQIAPVDHWRTVVDDHMPVRVVGAGRGTEIRDRLLGVGCDGDPHAPRAGVPGETVSSGLACVDDEQPPPGQFRVGRRSCAGLGDVGQRDVEVESAALAEFTVGLERATHQFDS